MDRKTLKEDVTEKEIEETLEEETENHENETKPRTQISNDTKSTQCLNVEQFIDSEVQCCYITYVSMRESNILVISVIFKLQDRVFFRDIFSLNMKL